MELIATSDPEPEHKPRLSYMAAAAIYAYGSVPKCPWCGKFRKESDFYGAPTAINGGGMCIDFGPKCKTCREKGKNDGSDAR